MPDTVEQTPGGELPPFEYRGDSRAPLALIGVGGWLLLLAVLWLGLGTTWWILLLLLLPVLPAIWEIIQNPASDLRLDDQDLRWSCPRSEAEIRLSEIDRITLTTRWDFSTRTTIHTRPGTRHELPPAVQPPGQIWEDALKSRGLSVTRHHFTRF